MKNLVNKETAASEINKWLDHKKISENKRDAQKDQIETLVNSICDGSLILNTDFSFTQTLKFPIEGEGKIEMKTLDYKPRIGVGEAHFHLQHFKSSDVDGRVLAYVLALTKKAKELVKKIDSEDYSISQAIAIFFI